MSRPSLGARLKEWRWKKRDLSSTPLGVVIEGCRSSLPGAERELYRRFGKMLSGVAMKRLAEPAATAWAEQAIRSAIGSTSPVELFSCRLWDSLDLEYPSVGMSVCRTFFLMQFLHEIGPRSSRLLEAFIYGLVPASAEDGQYLLKARLELARWLLARSNHELKRRTYGYINVGWIEDQLIREGER